MVPEPPADSPADPLGDLLRAAPRYVSTRPVEARRLTAARRWRTGRGSLLEARPGDWLLTDGDQEWTVAADVFDRSYRRSPDGRYLKSATVRAVRLTKATEVPTLEGRSTAAAGDWLLCGVDSELWPVTDAHFRRCYAPKELDEWADDDPARVNSEIVPPGLRGLEEVAAGTQLRSEILQGVYLVVLVSTPATTFVMRSSGAPDAVIDATAAVLLVVALAVRLWRQYRAPDGRWVRARRDLETARSTAWRRAATGAAAPGDSVRCRALGGTPIAVRWERYRRFRLGDQRAWFTRRGHQHARAARRLRWLQTTLAVVALGAAVVQAWQLQQTPVVNLMVALLAATEAWSQFRRSGFIATSYAETAAALDVLHDRVPATEDELAEVVDAVEHLLERELWTWVAISSAAVLTERRAR